MSILPEFKFTEVAKMTEPKLSFGLVAARGVDASALSGVIEGQKKLAIERIRGTRTEIEARLEALNSFFVRQGFSCPLPGQLRNVERKGFPKAPPLIEALLICEMANGVLMGVQDLEAIKQPLIYDVAKAGESFEGMRGVILCEEGEVVLRDSQAIIASYFQGPDKRTAVTPTTSYPVFFVFGAPGLPRSAMDAALLMAVDIVSPGAEEVDTDLFTL
jgi:DNA/RNA-binding domain of Phe-tRNA-synthetase-like protein